MFKKIPYLLTYIVVPLLVASLPLGAQVYSPAPNGYTISGNSVTGSGTNTTAAYFLDAGPSAYNFTILSGADLGNTTALGNSNELDFATGSVFNQGTLTATNFGINFQADGTVTNSGTIDGIVGGVVLNGNGTIVNTGTIEGPGGNAIQDVFTPTAGVGGITRLSIDNNGGTLYSSVGHAVDDENVLTSGTGNAIAGEELSINNSGAINGGSDTVFVDSGVNADAGSAMNRLDLTNSGSILSYGGSGVNVEGFYTQNLAGNGTDLVTFNNSGSITGAEYGVNLSTSNLTDAGLGKIDINLINSGIVTGGAGYVGAAVVEDSEHNGGGSINSVQILNTGVITAGSYAIEANIDNEYNIGDVTIHLSIVNANTITSASSYGIASETFNYENTGNATINVSAYNYGTITTYGPSGFESLGMYLEPYNVSDSGNGVVHVTMVNAGIINSANDYGLVDYESGNYSEGGTAVSTVDVLNSGSITGPATGVYLYDGNETNQGDGLSTISFVNTGTVSAIGPFGYGAYIESYNDSSVAGNATTQVSFNNAAGATITTGAETAVYEYASNESNHGAGLDSSTLNFVNNGTITSSQSDGADLGAGNTYGSGSSAATMEIANGGSISGSTGGMRSIISNSNMAGGSISVLTMTNTGSIQGLAGSGVDLELEDTAIGGAGSGAITFVNGTTGSVSGTTTGLFITTSGSTPSYTTNVFNQGTIIGGTSGVELDTYYGTVVAAGGTISGGTNSVLLQGDNSTVTVQGRATMIGTIQGSNFAGNTLNFDLMGMTSAQITAAKLAIAAAAGGPGTFTAADETYSFDGFETVNFNGASFAGSVDSGLSSLANGIDNHPLPGAYDAVYVQGAIDPQGTLNSLSGRQFLNAFSQIGLNNVTEIESLANNRAFQLRSGASGLDLSGLTVSPSSMIASLGGTANLLNRLGAGMIGGTTMSDSKNETTVTPANSPKWGAWASGTVTFSDESGNSSTNYHGTSGSPTIGVDYRLTPGLVVGALFNYTRGNVDFADGSNLDTDTELGALYADWTDGHWFVDGLAGYGNTSYDQNRTALDGSQASASPEGNEVLATLSGGYDFKVAGWTLSPEAGVQYTHLTKDSFNEAGAGAFDLNVGDQTIDSLRSKLGFHATRSFDVGGMKLIPQVNASWYHELLDDTNGVTNSLPGAPALGSFEVTTNPEGRDFALVGAGVTAVPAKWHDNVSLFLNYDAQVGQENFIAHTVDGGVRVNF